MKFYDAFHGVGGFRYGLEQAGMECVGGCELDKYACQAYGVINDEHCEPTDIRTVDPIRLPDFDIFVGGFPCQDLSVAGKRKGFDGERSVLFFEILRICEVKRPAYILLENVTGLFSHNGGETFRVVLQSLDELGYDAEWQVHNSAAYVPQNRERVFIIGHLRGQGTRTVFPFGVENSGLIEVIGKLDGNHEQNSRVYGIAGIAPTLSTMQGGGQEPKVLVAGHLECDSGGTGKIYDPDGIAPTQLSQHGNAVTKVVVVGNVNPSGNGMNGQVFDAEGMAPTLTTNKGEGNKILVNVSQITGVVETDQSLCLDANYFKGLGANQARTGVAEPRAVLTPGRPEKRQQGRRMKEPGEPIFTLTAQDLHGVAIIDDTQGFDGTRVYTDESPTLRANRSGLKVLNGYRIRKLTPLECFRLQSFPDWWYYKLKEHGISDSQLYKMAGNAVTSEVARQIGIRLIRSESA